jgi:site-specific DNA-methyltransferase (adenine-specific)
MLSGNRKLFKHQKLEISDWMPELYRVLKEGTHCYIFTNTLNLNEMLNESKKAKFKLHNLLVWEKNNCTPSQFYMKNCEYILF